jgi:iron complex transport system ATP-binding protein
MTMNVIQASQLNLGYNRQTIVKEFNLAIPSKTIVGLVGPNGSGKTTILRSLAGLLKPRAGVVLVQGESLAQLDSRKRARQIAWVPQRESLVWSLSVEEAIQLGRAPHRGWFLPYTKQDHRMVDWAINLTELNDLKDRPVDQLSGGEFQRVLIARALAQEPEILLLDEPTTNLDIHHQIQLLDLIKRLAIKKELTVILAIHDLNLAVRYCDQLILLDDGQQKGVGKPEKVLSEDNLQTVFGIEAKLYQDPWGYWAFSVRSGKNGGKEIKKTGKGKKSQKRVGDRLYGNG